jgi:uncharacterized radical SAM protein YgiQ
LLPDFKGYLTDLGGPSANMYFMRGKDQGLCQKCRKPSCIFPQICPNLNSSHKALRRLYQRVRSMDGIKKVTIGSGIRYDLFFNEAGLLKEPEYVLDLIEHHVSGRLKVAPEHSSEKVLKIMRKPAFDLFLKFKTLFEDLCRQRGIRQQIIPYFISSHPGCENSDMAELAVMSKKLNYRLEQVQDFTPTPMTLASVMYYTGIDPYTRKPIPVAKTQEQKKIQQKFFFWYKKELRRELTNELEKMGRPDLIGKLFNK